MKRNAVIPFCLVLLCLLTACQPTPQIEASDLIGVWVQEGGWPFFFVDEDGRYYYSAENRREEAFLFGTYQLEGNTITITGDAASEDCAMESMTWEVEVVDEDNLIFTPIDIDCAAWEGVEGEYPFARFQR